MHRRWRRRHGGQPSTTWKFKFENVRADLKMRTFFIYFFSHINPKKKGEILVKNFFTHHLEIFCFEHSGRFPPPPKKKKTVLLSYGLCIIILRYADNFDIVPRVWKVYISNPEPAKSHLPRFHVPFLSNAACTLNGFDDRNETLCL